MTKAENFDICCFVIFDWGCQKLISGRNTRVYTVLSFNFEIALIFSSFLAYKSSVVLPLLKNSCTKTVIRDTRFRFSFIFIQEEWVKQISQNNVNSGESSSIMLLKALHRRCYKSVCPKNFTENTGVLIQWICLKEIKCQ